MKIGLAQKIITPKSSCQMAGFDRRILPSVGTAEDLLVSVVVLEDYGQRCLLCTYDLLGTDIEFAESMAERLAAEFSVETDHVFVSATHTHAGPGTHFYGRNAYDADYVAHLQEQTVLAARTALNGLQEASMAVAAVPVVGVGTPRNAGPIGNAFAMPVRLLRFVTETDSIVLCRFACHPTVLDEKNRLFSRDLVGAAAKAADGTLVCFNGACGDLSTRYTRTASDLCEVGRLGTMLAEGIRTAEYQSECDVKPMRAVQKTVLLERIDNLTEERRAELLSELRERIAVCTDPKLLREYDSRLAVLERPPRPKEKPHRIRVGCLRLGNTALVFLPFEINHDDGQELERMLMEATGSSAVLCCYSGGYEGYLPSGRPLTADSSYEDFATRYPVDAKERIWECAKQCLLETNM